MWRAFAADLAPLDRIHPDKIPAASGILQVIGPGQDVARSYPQDIHVIIAVKYMRYRTDRTVPSINGSARIPLPAAPGRSNTFG